MYLRWKMVLAVVVAVLVGFFSWILIAMTRERGRPVVEVSQGRVVGVKEVTKEGLRYLAFRAIPYGTPPIGPLRFKDPVAAGPWEGVLDASTLPTLCTQADPHSGEDCLYINIYTPEDAPYSNNSLAVMVYIHGGSYTFGPEPGMDKVDALMGRDVVLAVMQYRLGLLGFMSTEDSVAPGNLGLKDQTLALQWVRHNIGAFGGNPLRVTIFGESAGGVSVHWQMLAPSAAGLFQGAIAQSGSALCPHAHGRDFLKVAQQVAALLDCPQETSTELVACLQKADAHTLTDMNTKFQEWHYHPTIFGPRVDGSYIPGDPVALMREKRYHNVPAIFGTNREDGALRAADWYVTPGIIKDLTTNFSVAGPLSLELTEDQEPQQTASRIFQYFLPGLVIDNNTAGNATKLNNQGYYQVPMDYTVELLSKHSAVYTYELHHRGQHSNMDRFLRQGFNAPGAELWVSHADDLQYFFEWKWGPLETSEDLAVREIFISTWTNFAKTLNPTPDDSLGLTWSTTGPPSFAHLVISTSPHMQKDQRTRDRAGLWDQLPLYPQLHP